MTRREPHWEWFLRRCTNRLTLRCRLDQWLCSIPTASARRWTRINVPTAWRGLRKCVWPRQIRPRRQGDAFSKMLSDTLLDRFAAMTSVWSAWEEPDCSPQSFPRTRSPTNQTRNKAAAFVGRYVFRENKGAAIVGFSTGKKIHVCKESR